MSRPSWNRHGAALSAATLVAAVVGAVTGVALIGPAWTPAWTPGVPILLILLAVVVTCGIGLLDLWLPAEHAPGGRVPPAPPGPVEPSQGPKDHYRGPEDEHVSVAHPVPSGQWWDRGAPARRPRAGNTARPEPVIDVEDVLEASIIAQCPSCGGFRLHVEPAPPGYHFQCVACARTWSWCQGESWPVGQIDPRRRAARRAPSA